MSTPKTAPVKKNKVANKSYLQSLHGMPQDKLESELKGLYQLQRIDTLIDEIRILRGELPLEVKELEEIVENLKTRIAKQQEEENNLDRMIAEKKNSAKDAQVLIKKYESQQNKVRNNREFESLGKEIEFQKLEIQLSEKWVKECKASITTKQELISQSESLLKEKQKDLKVKKDELEEIISETEKEEKSLIKKANEASEHINPLLLQAYNRIRPNFKNGLAVVTIERGACAGCFIKIPPQRQTEILTHKKLVVCEHCGRILVDNSLIEENKKSEPTSKVLESQEEA
jgi:predicted  nucleic acid-binding Zn-ribbon protein